VIIAANPFRDHFGYWMERAAGGEDITVTRRGKPLVRVVSARPPLPLAEGTPSG
jgi:prevent-host-death family protein